MQPEISERKKNITKNSEQVHVLKMDSFDDDEVVSGGSPSRLRISPVMTWASADHPNSPPIELCLSPVTFKWM